MDLSVTAIGLGGTFLYASSSLRSAYPVVWFPFVYAGGAVAVADGACFYAGAAAGFHIHRSVTDQQALFRPGGQRLHASSGPRQVQACWGIHRCPEHG